MKRMIMPLLLLVFVTLFCSVCILRTDRICNETADLIEQAGECFQRGSYEEAEELKAKNERAYVHEYLGIATGTGGDVFPNVEDFNSEELVDINGEKVPRWKT